MRRIPLHIWLAVAAYLVGMVFLVLFGVYVFSILATAAELQ